MVGGEMDYLDGLVGIAAPVVTAFPAETRLDTFVERCLIIDDAIHAQGVEQVHEVGGKALIYINLHIADTASNWYKEHGESCAIRTAYGSVLHESYGTGLDYVAMCPSASAWQNAIVAAVERTRKNGVDGYWFDQLMEMPGNLCYNREHGHTTPATAYAEGYDTLFERINALTAEKDCIYACEGTCDAYLRYIDCCGLMWARQFGSSPQSAPKITRYTLPMNSQKANISAKPSTESRITDVSCDPRMVSIRVSRLNSRAPDATVFTTEESTPLEWPSPISPI